MKMDLPLSSKLSEAKVLHWILDMSCNFSSKTCYSSLFLFCQSHIAATDVERLPGSSNSDKSLTPLRSEVSLILDMYALDIDDCSLYYCDDKILNIASEQSVDSKTCSNVNIQISKSQMESYANTYKYLKDMNISGCRLEFSVQEHCIDIKVPTDAVRARLSQQVFVVKIMYHTQKNGPCLTWTKDQDSMPCVYTSGHLLNNRSLLPCQDTPDNLSTWHCFVSVADEKCNDKSLDGDSRVNVLMTGEAKPTIEEKDGSTLFAYQSSYPMPTSTFALAVGSWPCYRNSDSSSSEIKNVHRNVPSIRVFCPNKLHCPGLATLCDYLPECLQALDGILGSYPLSRLDIVVVPAGFDSLGMMSPHLLFLSQSMLMSNETVATGSLLYRIAHELCHTWFGVMMGPQDWTEEWLTEGLCCYLEDHVHAEACHWSELERRERLELRCLLKYKLLKAEMEYTPETLQTLRPNSDISSERNEMDTSAQSVVDTTAQSVVKNGLNSDKTLLQVHYLKGFFLLKHIEKVTGREHVLVVLKQFVSKWLGQLFTSNDLLEYLFEQLPLLRATGLTIDQIGREWLDTPGMPKSLVTFEEDLTNNALFNAVRYKVSAIKAQVKPKGRKRSCSSIGTTLKEPQGICLPSVTWNSSQDLISEQKLLLLDCLVESDVNLSASQLANIRAELNITQSGPEIQHSWCELVIKRTAVKWMSDVEEFLTNHQAMGVYLYGELMISENRRLQSVAQLMFKKLKDGMSEAQRKAVQEMIYPT